MNPGRTLRMVGLGLIVAGVSVGTVLQEIAHLKARMNETRTKVLTRVQEPGVIITMLGIALLDASDSPELQMQRRTGK